MFADLKNLMATAAAARVCLPALDIGGGQPDFLQGILAACEAARCPAVLLVWAPGATYVGLDACVDLVASFARRASVPVVLHLDHGKDAETVSRALDLGFASVMFDGSEHPLDENIRLTRVMAELAHARGATIEGELGSFGQEQADAAGDSHLADPEQAGRFVAETGVDLLAPAVGNAHGFYKAPPRLRFDLIERIAAVTGATSAGPASWACGRSTSPASCTATSARPSRQPPARARAGTRCSAPAGRPSGNGRRGSSANWAWGG